MNTSAGLAAAALILASVGRAPPQTYPRSPVYRCPDCRAVARVRWKRSRLEPRKRWLLAWCSCGASWIEILEVNGVIR